MAKEKQEQQASKDYGSMSYEELRQISRNDHHEDVVQYDKQQNALCLVVLGGICLICGILFTMVITPKESWR